MMETKLGLRFRCCRLARLVGCPFVGNVADGAAAVAVVPGVGVHHPCKEETLENVVPDNHLHNRSHRAVEDLEDRVGIHSHTRDDGERGILLEEDIHEKTEAAIHNHSVGEPHTKDMMGIPAEPPRSLVVAGRDILPCPSMDLDGHEDQEATWVDIRPA